MSSVKSISHVFTSTVRKVKAASLKAQRARQPFVKASVVADTFVPSKPVAQTRVSKNAEFLDALFKNANGDNPNLTKKYATDNIILITKKNDNGVITRYFAPVRKSGMPAGVFEYVKSYPDATSIHRCSDGRVVGKIGHDSVCKWGKSDKPKSISQWRDILNTVKNMPKILSK